MYWKSKQYYYPVYAHRELGRPTKEEKGRIHDKGITVEQAKLLPYANHELIAIIRYVYWVQNGYQSALLSLSDLKREGLWELLLNIISVKTKRMSKIAAVEFLRFLTSMKKHPEGEYGENPTKARYEPSLTNALIDKSAYLNKLSELAFCFPPTMLQTDEGGTFEIRKWTCSLGGNHSKTFVSGW